ncbi:Hypothetical_protein [Hexamita inflata]|uniref:Hypothetical_protein n=1 Tax=Hexamita inflata TaxID=28002 RepID=A0AA86QQU9_9EUKA|nr:Hypothetical protein HINF_LOCUS50555 [Hexamita inflata]
MFAFAKQLERSLKIVSARAEQTDLTTRCLAIVYLDRVWQVKIVCTSLKTQILLLATKQYIWIFGILLRLPSLYLAYPAVLQFQVLKQLTTRSSQLTTIFQQDQYISHKARLQMLKYNWVVSLLDLCPCFNQPRLLKLQQIR